MGKEEEAIYLIRMAADMSKRYYGKPLRCSLCFCKIIFGYISHQIQLALCHSHFRFSFSV